MTDIVYWRWLMPISLAVVASLIFFSVGGGITIDQSAVLISIPLIILFTVQPYFFSWWGGLMSSGIRTAIERLEPPLTEPPQQMPWSSLAPRVKWRVVGVLVFIGC